MIKVFNALNVAVSCLGNHDLDFGVAKMVDLTTRTAPTQWLLGNLYHDGKPVGGLATHCVREVPLSGTSRTIKVGFLGLAGPDWLGQMCPVVTEELLYIDYVTEGRDLARMLKSELGCELVIALTHMRCPEDRNLAR